MIYVHGTQQANRLTASMLLLQDTQDPNPLIRALAVRTMGCIRVDKITEYLCDPLQRCLKVSDAILLQILVLNTSQMLSCMLRR